MVKSSTAELKALTFYSRPLHGPEKNYSTTELEGLALYSAVNYFAHLLYGKKSQVYADHKGLVSFRTSKMLNRRLQNWALKLQDYDFDVIYSPGPANGNVDGLYRQAQHPVKTSEDGGRLSMEGCGDNPTRERDEIQRRDGEY